VRARMPGSSELGGLVGQPTTAALLNEVRPPRPRRCEQSRIRRARRVPIGPWCETESSRKTHRRPRRSDRCESAPDAPLTQAQRSLPSSLHGGDSTGDARGETHRLELTRDRCRAQAPRETRRRCVHETGCSAI
jgi:hypothetical protein